MLSPAQGLLRCLRAASLGVVGFALALAAHVAAGGATPGPAGLLLLAGMIGLAAVMLTGARLSSARVRVSLAVMQVVLHEAFMWLSAPAACVMPVMNAPVGGHMGTGMGQGAQPVLDCAVGMTHAGMGQSSVFAATAMLGAHIAATALMAALLAYGERVLWFAAGWVRPASLLRVGAPELPAVRHFSVGAPPMLRVRFAFGGVGRRGPPPPGLFAIVYDR
jgi:hypothetical protein